jgi:DNA-binding transcriptional ArsR family regulator
MSDSSSETDGPVRSGDIGEAGVVYPGGAAAAGLSASLERDRPISELKADLFRSLAHPARIRIIEVLSSGERSVGEMQPMVGIESSHLSQQLGVLRRAGLLVNRREGPMVFYSIRNPILAELLAVAKALLISTLAETHTLLAGLSDSSSR